MIIQDLILQVNDSNKHLENYGWCSPGKAMKIIDIMDQVQPKLSVEIGVFGGRSLMPMALWHKLHGGMVWGIDPWSNPIAAQDYNGANEEWWKTVNMDQVYKMCVSTIDKFMVRDYVRLCVATSDDITLPDEPIGLLHIDGQHTAQAVKDVTRWVPLVGDGGAVIMDDITWMNDGKSHVAEAADLLQELGFVKGELIDTGAVFYN